MLPLASLLHYLSDQSSTKKFAIVMVYYKLLNEVLIQRLLNKKGLKKNHKQFTD